MNNSTEDLRRELALKDVGADADPSGIEYHMDWLAEMSQAEFDAYCVLMANL